MSRNQERREQSSKEPTGTVFVRTRHPTVPGASSRREDRTRMAPSTLSRKTVLMEMVH